MIGNRELFDKIAESLIADYARVYLVNTKTNKYSRYYINQDSHLLVEDRKGDDFFGYIAERAGQEVYEEDKHFFQNDILKEKLLKIDKLSFSSCSSLFSNLSQIDTHQNK